MQELYQSHARDSLSELMGEIFIVRNSQPSQQKLRFKHISKEMERVLAYSVIHRQTGDHDFIPLSW